MLAVALIVSGVSRIAFGVGIKPTSGWGWIVPAGVLSLLVGVPIGISWPDTLWILCAALAVDLIGQGAACTSLGLALRSRR